MVMHFVMIALALLLLFIGAEGLVRGSVSVAFRAGLSPLVIGLTIVAFGTSSPELVVSIKAALAGQGDIAVGNVVGSNIFNIAIILGITALICPIPVHRQVIKIDGPIALAVAALLVVLLLDGQLSRLEGGLLFAGIVAYTFLNFRFAANTPAAADVTDLPTSTPSRSVALDLAMIGGGLAVLVLGSNLLVENAVAVAQAFGVSEAIIGLTIVAAGTSMPELATSVVAALRKQSDIAIGNIIGSNVFNVLGILGVGSLVAPINAAGISTIDYAVMLGFSLLLLPLLYTGRILHRIEGIALLLLYGGYLWLLWPK